MKKSLYMLFALLISMNIIAKNKPEILLSIGDVKITKDEFQRNYEKNNKNLLDENDKKSPADYLELYINYKLKVEEAKTLGYDTVSSFIDELRGYRDQLAAPYLTDVSFTENMVNQEYYRTTHERKASHILIRTSKDEDPEHIKMAYNKLDSIRQLALNGEDFGELAEKYSEDPSAKQNKGDLGYFTAFRMVFPFEDAAFKTPVGKISEIVRTNFGFHLIKVEDEREVTGDMRAAHIMKMYPRNKTEEIRQKLKHEIDSIYSLVLRGDDFAELAKQYSDDKRSGAEGGELRWFNTSNMVPSFAEAAFKLENDGDVSEVVETPYGWHIIKRLQFRPVQPLEEIREDLESKIKKDPEISKHSKQFFYEKLRALYQLTINNEALDYLVSLSDTAIKDGVWVKPEGDFDKQLVQFADQKYILNEFSEYLESQNLFSEMDNTKSILKKQLDSFINEKLLAYEDSHLEQKYPEFASLMEEYHDGILLFNISKDKIWDVAGTDTTALQAYYNSTDKKYHWGEHFKGWVLHAEDAETKLKAESTIASDPEISKEELLAMINADGKELLKITEGDFEYGDNEIVDYVYWDKIKPENLNDSLSFTHGEIVDGGVKELKDAWGLYSSDYQEQLEKDWVADLRKKYPIKINKKILKEIPEVK